MKRSIVVFIVCALVVSMAGCMSGTSISCFADSGESVDLMENVTPRAVAGGAIPDPVAYLDFSLQLLEKCGGEGNTLISPLSVYSALAMTANGAVGETRTQMEETLGMTVGEMNDWLYSFLAGEREELKLANAIWFTNDERFTANQDFLQTNADYYGAGIYSAPFDDSTLKEINIWVKENTGGMIPEILDEIKPDAVMYLVNALAFEAKWQTVYTKNQVRKGDFTLEDGTTCRVDFMHSEESRYLENDIATGFMKHYRGGDYAFVALLPKEGMPMTEFLAALDGEMMKELLASVENTIVDTALPGFKAEYGVEMAEILRDMGMELPFDPQNADFSGLGTSAAGNISINRVIHKTFISVTAEGTRAAAATVVEPTDGAAFIEGEIKEVILNRPFLYMIVDTESGIPLFIGTLMDPGTAR